MAGTRSIGALVQHNAHAHSLLAPIFRKPVAAAAAPIVVGFVDYGFDVLHPTLLDAARQRSRFQYLWDQNAHHWPGAFTKKGSIFGETGQATIEGELDGDELTALINAARHAFSREPVEAIYDPHAGYFVPTQDFNGARGTLSASIAAGSPHEGFTGFAPEAELIGVQLALQQHHWREQGADGTPDWKGWAVGERARWDKWKSYGDAPQLSAALDYLYSRAQAMNAAGLIINLPDGAWPGAHDGSSQLERKIEELTQRGYGDDGPCCIVVSGRGFYDSIAQDRTFEFDLTGGCDLEWSIDAGSPHHAKLEVCYESAEPIDAEFLLIDPSRTIGSGQVAARYPLSLQRTLPISMGRRACGIVDHDLQADGKAQIRIGLHPPYLPHSIAKDENNKTHWVLRLMPRNDRAPLKARVWYDYLSGDISLRGSGDGREGLSAVGPQGRVILVSPVDDAGSARATAPDTHRRIACTDTSGAIRIDVPDLQFTCAKSQSFDFVETSGAAAASAFIAGAITRLMAEEAERWAHDQVILRLIERLVDPEIGRGPEPARSTTAALRYSQPARETDPTGSRQRKHG